MFEHKARVLQGRPLGMDSSLRLPELSRLGLLEPGSSFVPALGEKRRPMTGVLRQNCVQLGRRPSVLVVRDGERLLRAERSASFGYRRAPERCRSHCGTDGDRTGG